MAEPTVMLCATLVDVAGKVLASDEVECWRRVNQAFDQIWFQSVTGEGFDWGYVEEGHTVFGIHYYVDGERIYEVDLVPFTTTGDLIVGSMLTIGRADS